MAEECELWSVTMADKSREEELSREEEELTRLPWRLIKVCYLRSELVNLMTSISIYGHKGESSILVSED